MTSERPTTYTPELGDRICGLLAEGKTLSAICQDNSDLPSERTIRRWARDPDHPLAKLYGLAREVGYQTMADHIIDIADGRDEGETAERSRLRVDTRKWLLSKALPKIYGDKLEVKPEGMGDFASIWAAISSGAIDKAKLGKL